MDERKLPELFEAVLECETYVSTTSDSRRSEEFRARVDVGLTTCERASVMVDQLGVFSHNEDELEEITTDSIRYLALPAIHASLLDSSAAGAGEARTASLRRQRRLYVHFLRRCHQYGVSPALTRTVFTTGDDGADEANTSATTTTTPVDEDEDFASIRLPDAAAITRDDRIARLRAKAANETEMRELRKYVEQEHVEEEQKRAFHVGLVKQWMFRALEELVAIQRELALLANRARGVPEATGTSSSSITAAAGGRGRPIDTFVLTRNDVQKRVFGAGYSSLPTYTVDEWFDQQLAKGAIPPPSAVTGAGGGGVTEETTAEEKDAEEEDDLADDPDRLRQKREWDDWKDDHRRGCGNTIGKG